MSHSIIINYYDKHLEERKFEMIQVPFIPITGDQIILNGNAYEVSKRVFDIDRIETIFYLNQAE